VVSFSLFRSWRLSREWRAIRSSRAKGQGALELVLILPVFVMFVLLVVDAAFALVAEKISGPLADTFGSYLRQVGLGRARRDAFADVAERTGVVDLVRVAGAVAQSEQIGGTLADVLRLQAEELRVIRRQRAQEAAQPAPILMTIPTTLCFLPATASVVIVPSILNLMEYLGRMRAH
jgi:tight adherence protein C